MKKTYLLLCLGIFSSSQTLAEAEAHVYQGQQIPQNFFDSNQPHGLNLENIKNDLKERRTRGEGGDSFSASISHYISNGEKLKQLVDKRASLQASMDNTKSSTMKKDLQGQLVMLNTMINETRKIRQGYIQKLQDAGLTSEQIGKLPSQLPK